MDRSPCSPAVAECGETMPNVDAELEMLETVQSSNAPTVSANKDKEDKKVSSNETTSLESQQSIIPEKNILSETRLLHDVQEADAEPAQSEVQEICHVDKPSTGTECFSTDLHIPMENDPAVKQTEQRGEVSDTVNDARTDTQFERNAETSAEYTDLMSDSPLKRISISNLSDHGQVIQDEDLHAKSSGQVSSEQSSMGKVGDLHMDMGNVQSSASDSNKNELPSFSKAELEQKKSLVQSATNKLTQKQLRKMGVGAILEALQSGKIEDVNKDSTGDVDVSKRKKDDCEISSEIPKKCLRPNVGGFTDSDKCVEEHQLTDKKPENTLDSNNPQNFKSTVTIIGKEKSSDVECSFDKLEGIEDPVVERVNERDEVTVPSVITDNMTWEDTSYTNAESFRSEEWENDFTKAPVLLTGAYKEFECTSENFLKGCKWSPDGTCILTNSDDSCLRVFNLPAELYEGKSMGLPEMNAVLKMHEGELIYDYTWYPLMNSLRPETCCFASTSRDTPVHMWDAFTGSLRCTFRAFDQMDEVVSAQSLAFSLDGHKLYCGFNKSIRVFDTSKPGREFQNRPTFNKTGQPGIISCIAMNPGDPKMYAAGSYARSVALYSEPAGDMVCMFEGQQGGVTHIMFSPDGNQLYTGGRKDSEILCWDVRNPGEILFTVNRKMSTNQRFYFDLDNTGRHLVSGNDDGTITVWDTATAAASPIKEPVLESTLTFPGHKDAVNGVSLHPSMPLMVTSCGQRHCSRPNLMDMSDSEEEEEDSRENSLKLWWIGR